MSSHPQPRVALFVTCLVDLFRPAVGFAAVKLLEDAGCRVEVPRGQTCCGQPAYNQGDRADTVAIARRTLGAFAGYDYVVVPSGSCAGMLKKHWPELFAEGSPEAEQAREMAARTFELTAFLVDVLGAPVVAGELTTRVTYHDSCSSLRELGVRAQPRRLLASIKGLDLAELPESEVCCGFGGTFCVKYPEISTKMVDDKVRAIESTGAALVLAADLGCLMNIAGRLKRQGSTVEARHVAEVLAGALDQPPIGSA
jgi:L-lactate dehydrogenase complex protein LldE